MAARTGSMSRATRTPGLWLALAGALGTLGAGCAGPTPSDARPANLAITPSGGYASAAIPVVISGTGFLAKVTQPQGGGQPVLDTQHRAWLGSTELTSVTWLGTTTLHAVVPAGIAPGKYDLTVENALGNRGTEQGAYTAYATPRFSAVATFDRATVDVGQSFTLTVTVLNGGTSAIEGLRIGVPTVSSSDGGSARPTSAQPPVPSAIAAGETLTFAWTYSATTSGHVSVTVEIAGTDSAGGEAVTAALAAPAGALIQLPAALTATWIEPPSTQPINSPVTMTLELANAAGAATAEVTGVTPSTSPASNVSCAAVDPAPSASAPIQIVGGSSQRFTWSCIATVFGSYQLGAAVVATDLNTGGPLSVPTTLVTVSYTTPLLLTVVAAGTGSGTVTSTPAGIAGCGQGVGTCSASFLSGTTVTLAASPASGSTVGWAGCTPAAGSPTQCSVAIDGAKTVTATFTLDQETLTITPPSNGTITCGGGACASSYPYGTVVTLTASPNTFWAFSAWTGDCAGSATNTCTLTMTAARTVGATFRFFF
jgi:hypothetical protein